MCRPMTRCTRRKRPASTPMRSRRRRLARRPSGTVRRRQTIRVSALIQRRAAAVSRLPSAWSSAKSLARRRSGSLRVQRQWNGPPCTRPRSSRRWRREICTMTWNGSAGSAWRICSRTSRTRFRRCARKSARRRWTSCARRPCCAVIWRARSRSTRRWSGDSSGWSCVWKSSGRRWPRFAEITRRKRPTPRHGKRANALNGPLLFSAPRSTATAERGYCIFPLFLKKITIQIELWIELHASVWVCNSECALECHLNRFNWIRIDVTISC